VFTTAHHWSLPSAKLIQPSPSHPISLRSILILSSHVRLSLLCASLFLTSPPTPPKAFLFYLYAFHMPCPSHPSRLDHSNYTWRTIQITNLLVMQFSPPSRHFIPPNILLGTLSSNTLSLYSSLNVGNQVSHPYRITGNILVLYILMSTFSDSGREDKHGVNSAS
jgi:hypothetical protein